MEPTPRFSRHHLILRAGRFKGKLALFPALFYTEEWQVFSGGSETDVSR